jgi:Ca2+-binding EF-hand superfamily protein
MYKFLRAAALTALLAGVSSIPTWAQGDAADKLFAELDTSKDGKLTQSEFTAHSDFTAEVFAKWDADGDKAISKAEFKAGYGG